MSQDEFHDGQLQTKRSFRYCIRNRIPTFIMSASLPETIEAQLKDYIRENRDDLAQDAWVVSKINFELRHQKFQVSFLFISDDGQHVVPNENWNTSPYLDPVKYDVDSVAEWAFKFVQYLNDLNLTGSYLIILDSLKAINVVRQKVKHVAGGRKVFIVQL
uniref:Uncharacterized protein n=1 Tax=Panagrolaimus superbus TaxID=310955 RepID=A0A914YJG4_9BILA